MRQCARVSGCIYRYLAHADAKRMARCDAKRDHLKCPARLVEHSLVSTAHSNTHTSSITQNAFITATHCNAPQRTSTRCNALQRMQRTASHCIALHRTATHCNALQHAAKRRNTLTLLLYPCRYCHAHQHTATYCNELRHTATHYNVVQRTATYYNTLLHNVRRASACKGRRARSCAIA